MNGEDVGVAEQVVLRNVVDARLLRLVRRQVRAPGDDPHAERLGDGCDALAELAEAQRAERLAFHIVSHGDLPRRPGFHAGVLEADAAGQFQHQADGDRGCRVAEAAGAADRNAALGRRLDVEGIVAGAGGDQELQVGQRLDHLAREGGALAHADDDGEALQRLDRRVGASERLVEHGDVDVFGDRRPVGKFQRDVLIIVEDGCLDHTHELLACTRTSSGRDNLEPVGRKDRGYQSGGRPCLARYFGPGPRM